MSNFDLDDMRELVRLSGGNAVAGNQLMYNLKSRGIEYDLMPWCRRRRIPIIAYSPLDQGKLVRSRTLKRIAAQLGPTAPQVALAWTLRRNGIIAIPKAASEGHVHENHAALDLRLSKADLAELDRAFPPPRRARPLETV